MTLSKLQHPSHCYIPPATHVDTIEWYDINFQTSGYQEFLGGYLFPIGHYRIHAVGWWTAWMFYDPNYWYIRYGDPPGFAGGCIPIYGSHIKYNGVTHFVEDIATVLIFDETNSSFEVEFNVTSPSVIAIWIADTPYYDNSGRATWTIYS